MDDRADLVQTMYLYYSQGWSLKDVGDKFNYDRATIAYWFRKHNLPMRPGPESHRSSWLLKNRDWILKMYTDYCREGVSLEKVADKYGTSKGNISRLFRKLGLDVRPAHRPKGS